MALRQASQRASKWGDEWSLKAFGADEARYVVHSALSSPSLLPCIFAFCSPRMSGSDELSAAIFLYDLQLCEQVVRSIVGSLLLFSGGVSCGRADRSQPVEVFIFRSSVSCCFGLVLCFLSSERFPDIRILLVLPLPPLAFSAPKLQLSS